MTGDASRFPEPGVQRIGMLNWYGTRTLYLKEVRRFLKVHTQTIWAPAVTTLLFLVIFTVALGRGGQTILGVPFATFLGPGLIAMAMVQNAFANTSSSLMIGKVQGTIVDILMPPLSPGELLLGYVGGGVTRAFAVGAAVWLAIALWPGADATIRAPWAVLYFGLMGSILLSLLGILTGIWAEKFDHTAAITNFVIQPLSLLSGTFYTLDRLGGIWSTVSHINPFFFIIDGFRYGFLGIADGPLAWGALYLLAINAALGAVTYAVLRTGWRLKA
ncbi:ABC transporter permease [Pedomonas sp. V897]|uniref:ABC transporter permease n=1 Tax=Pedomonas sp. V897 TaxID=3446482 RepID=UPI003EDE9CF1